MGRRMDAGITVSAWYVAFYIRLSKETKRHDESDSVVNQRMFLAQSLQKLKERYPDEKYVLVDEYIDDGETGTDSDRQSFQRLLTDMENRRVNMIMFKDLSRLGRNYTETGYYLDQFFVRHDIRYICLTSPFIDSYRTQDIANSPMIPIQNVFNDDFARTTSLKIRDVFQSKKEAGQFIGAFAPYGYAKNPKNKNAFVIDEEAARVVRDIYGWFADEGMSKRGIAQRLNELCIPNPAAYKRQNGLSYKNPASALLGASDVEKWSPRTVHNILLNEVYIGNMVQGRQRIKSYKVHDRVTMPPSTWSIVEGTHEPIIDKALFEKAQSLHKRDTRTPNDGGKVHMLAGFIKCADCKKSMRKAKSKNGSVYYFCRSYYDKKTCSRRSILADKLESVILDAIQKQIAVANCMASIMEKIESAPIAFEKSARSIKLLQARRKELQQCKNMKTDLYIDLKKKLIDQDEYAALRARFEKQEEELSAAIAQLETEQGALTDGVNPEEPYLAVFKKHENIKTLTRNLLADLVDNVFIDRDSSVIIAFKFASRYKSVTELADANMA